MARTPAFQAGDRGFDPRRPYYLVNVFTGADGSYGNPLAVFLDGAPDGLGFAYCWAWVDEAAGMVRARSFVPEHGIHEDEATGVAALRLGGKLGRSIEVRQGKGSRIYVRPGPDGTVEVGGRVVDRGEHVYGG